MHALSDLFLASHHHSTAMNLHLLFLAAAALALLLLLPGHGVEGRHHRHHGDGCPPFSCGHLTGVSSPFRRRGDPPWCGDDSYELSCTDTQAAILIGHVMYHVKSIGWSDSTFWVIDAALESDSSSSSCPLPRWNWPPFPQGLHGLHHNILVKLAPEEDCFWATFVRCSQEQRVEHNGIYMPVHCLSTNNSFVYVLTGWNPNDIMELEPSCGYLAMTPLGHRRWNPVVPWHANLSYLDVVMSMRNGISVQFPFKYHLFLDIGECLTTMGSTKDWTEIILLLSEFFTACVTERLPLPFRIFFPYATFIFKGIAVLCRFLLAPLAVLIFLSYQYRKTRITIDAVEKFLRMQHMLGLTRYAYTDITAITSHFRDKLGQGGYGSVYKGVILPGHVHVAVKMLENSQSNGEEFISEVATIGRIHHVNVVRLVGFCSEEMRRALVYEYMPRGSLDKYIFTSNKTFTWDKVNEIALGIARGINYLHQGCDMQILHFDIKPQNILLDNNFVPKIADFGLAKLCPRDKSFVPSSILRGTIGYIAPEMISRSFGIISSKSDVYSFGMLLLEMAGGRKNACPKTTNSSQRYYPSWVYNCLTQQEVGEITSTDDMHELERKLCVIGLWCIQMKSHDRPTMSEVIEMLEGGADGLQIPPKPFFCEDEQSFSATNAYLFSDELADISEEDG